MFFLSTACFGSYWRLVLSYTWIILMAIENNPVDTFICSYVSPIYFEFLHLSWQDMSAFDQSGLVRVVRMVFLTDCNLYTLLSRYERILEKLFFWTRSLCGLLTYLRKKTCFRAKLRRRLISFAQYVVTGHLLYCMRLCATRILLSY